MKNYECLRCAAALFAVFACSGSPPVDAPVGSRASELANAQKDKNRDFPDVVEVLNSGYCSGTLIGCRQILTAAHCVCEPLPAGSDSGVADATTCTLPVTVRFGKAAKGTTTRDGDATVHPWYRMVKTNGIVTSNRGDLAVIKLRSSAPDWAQVRIDPGGTRGGLGTLLGTAPPAGGQEVTLVGYGARSASTTRKEPNGRCTKFTQDHVRRWGTTVVGSEPSIFPGFFYIEKRSDDSNSPLVLPGDSGGPAFLGDEIVGVASMDSCVAQWPIATQATIAGFGWYTTLDTIDEVKSETLHDWVSRQLTDCSGEITCADGMKNGEETGVDCGGPTCPRCPGSEVAKGSDDIGSSPEFEDTAYTNADNGHTLQWAMYLHVQPDADGVACGLDFPLIRRSLDDQFTVRVYIDPQNFGASGFVDLNATKIPAQWGGQWTRFQLSPCVALSQGEDIRFFFQDAVSPFNTWPAGAGIAQARLETPDSIQYQQQSYDLSQNYNQYIDDSHQAGFRIVYQAP